ncbi:D-alanyl-lipoteichoic acid acyltransferase DltB, MBOAT superfamily [bacterium A37T11]|nr:D-alanyl-lipoteichoic acid acyltransferase DltB, MBOAT superfamily [bacterium A37T11]
MAIQLPDIDLSRLLDQFIYHKESPLIFNSGIFLFIFFGFISVYALLSKTHHAKFLFVVLFSLYFYYKSSGFYFLLLIFSTVVDYNLGKWMHQSENQGKRRFLLVFSIVLNLGILLYFKYTNFILQTYDDVMGRHFERMDIFLPIGISFFTFQSLSYSIDIYRKQLEPAPHILNYAFFVSFFPFLVAGPIVRASYFLPQLQKPTFVSKEMLGRGIFLIVCGLLKKAVIADYISINFVDRIFDNPSLYSGLENLFGLYGYALQIYCDFSGYSDMAIGIALLLGFQFPDHYNFNAPYRSLNITEFWRRWHISLSTWLRDYLYISLGGNRKGKFRAYLNQFITMVLGGLWHGASLRFLLWGAMHGLALAINKIWLTITKQKAVGGRSSLMGTVLGWFITFHFVCFCWIFFRADNMETAGKMLHQIFHQFHPQLFFEFVKGYQVVVALMALGYLLHFVPDTMETATQRAVIRMPLLGKALLLVLTIVWVIQMKSSEIQPFIYFQF